MASMPHLSQLAREHRDDGFTVIGVTAEDRRNTLEKVREMVADKGDGMDYTVAWDTGRETYAAFMDASGSRGIPTSFLVDGDGKVAWIGHPMGVDLPLGMVLDGTWNYEEGPALLEEIGERKMSVSMSLESDPAAALATLDALAEEHPLAVKGMERVRFDLYTRIPARHEDAAKLGRHLVGIAVEEGNSGSLNGLAWMLVDPEVPREHRFLDLAQLAAEHADELTGGTDASILDTVARVHSWKGDLAKAVAIQTRAVEHAEGRQKDALAEVLAEYAAAATRAELEALGYLGGDDEGDG